MQMLACVVFGDRSYSPTVIHLLVEPVQSANP